MSNTIKKQVRVGGQLLANNDPKMKISLDPTTGVQIDQSKMGVDTITYKFLEDVTEEKVHDLTLSFLYDNTHYVETPLTITQAAVIRPVIVPKDFNVTIFERGSEVPFDVTYRDESVIGTIKDVTITPTEYVHTDGGLNYHIYDGPTAGGELSVEYAFTITAGGKDIQLTHTAKFTLAAWDGKYFKVIGAPVGIYMARGVVQSFTYTTTFHGDDWTSKTRLLNLAWPTIQSQAYIDGKQTVKLASNVMNWTRVEFIYARTDTTETLLDRDRVIITTEVRVETESGVKVTRVGDPPEITGYKGDQIQITNHFMLEDAATIPWTDGRIRGKVVTGGGAGNKDVQCKIVSYTAEGPVIEIVGPLWNEKSSNYMQFWLGDDDSVITDPMDLWVTPLAKTLTVTQPAGVNGKFGDTVTIPTQIKSDGVVIPTNSEGLVFTLSDARFEVVEQTETQLKVKINHDNDSAVDASININVTVTYPKHIDAKYVQVITVKPTYVVTVTDIFPTSTDAVKTILNGYQKFSFKISDGNGKSYAADDPAVTITKLDSGTADYFNIIQVIPEGMIVTGTKVSGTEIAANFNVAITGIPGSKNIGFPVSIINATPKAENSFYTAGPALTPNSVIDPLWFLIKADTTTGGQTKEEEIVGFKLSNETGKNAMLKPGEPLAWEPSRNVIHNFETGWTGGNVILNGWWVYNYMGNATKIATGTIPVPQVPMVVESQTETIDADNTEQTAFAVLSQIRTGGVKVNPDGEITALTVDGVASTLDTFPLTMTAGRFEYKLKNNIGGTLAIKATVKDEIGASYTVDMTVKADKSYTITIEDSPISTEMWAKGTALPFKVLNKGVEVESEEIVGLKFTANGVVTVGSTPDQWFINTDTPTVAKEAHDVVVQYTFRMVGDPEDTVRNASGTFHVAAYDGKQYVMEFIGLDQKDPRMFVHQRDKGQYFQIRVKDKGSYGGLRSVSAGTSNNNLSVTASGSGGTTITYTITANTMNANGVVAIKPTVRTIGTGVTVTGDMYIQVYGYKNELQYALRSYGIEGKYGDEVDVFAKLYNGNQLVNLADTDITFDQDGMVEIIPESISGQYFKVRFKEQITAQKAQELSITFALKETPAIKSVPQIWYVTQKPDLLPLELAEGFVKTGTGEKEVTLTQAVQIPE